jgi:hypothetical protein
MNPRPCAGFLMPTESPESVDKSRALRQAERPQWCGLGIPVSDFQRLLTRKRTFARED